MTLLINNGEPIDMVAITAEGGIDNTKYNLIILDYYDNTYVNKIFEKYNNQIETISFYKFGETIPLNGKYIDFNLPNIYINLKGITMYDFVVTDKDIVYTS